MKSPPDHRIPLSHPQQRVWYTELMYPGTGVSNLIGCIHFPGRRSELQALGDAIRQVVRRHDTLRLRLARTSSLICEQYFGDPVDLDLPVYEIGQSRTSLLEQSKLPLVLYDTPLVMFQLLCLPDDRIGYYFKFHHINVDAWTVSLLNNEIYKAYKGGASAQRAAPGTSFSEFFEREQRYLDSDQRREDEAFWQQHLAGLELEPSHGGPTASSAALQGASSIIATKRYEHEFDPELSAAITSFCKAQQTTVFRYLLAVFAIHYADRQAGKDVVLSTSHHNRLTPREKGMAGMTISPLSMRFPVPREVAFDAFLRQVHTISSACLSRQQHPYDLLSPYLRSQGNDPKQLLRWFVNFVPSFDGEYAVERYSPGADLAEFNVKINPNQRPRSAPLQLGVDARLALYDEEAVRSIFAHVEQIARETLARPQESIRALIQGSPRAAPAPVASRRRQRPLQTFPELFEQTARRFPDNVALVDGRGDKTYAALLAEVAALRGELLRRAVRPGDRVAVVTDRTADFVVAVLAILGAGAAYVPITPDTPAERLTQILGDAGVSLVLTDTPGELDGRPCVTVAEHRQHDSTAPMVQSGPEDVAYVIYTSGSTGSPKGVMVPHRALANLCAWYADLCDVTERDRCAAYCSFMFDVSVGELLTPLIRGAAVYVVPNAQRSSVSELGRYFDRSQITVATLPTKVGELFQAHVEPATLRVLTVIGEKLHPSSVKRTYKLINTYGPTEATVFATAYVVSGDEADIPIGSPAANTWTYVVDQHDQLVTAGEEGELLLAGEQIALGYIGNPELTREVFFENPFAEGEGDAIAYRTGDIVRARPDGELLYVGRRDRQIKIRGFRVEPEEIELCLVEHPAVEQCYVMVRDQGGEKALIAYCVCEQSAGPATAEGSGAMEQALRQYVQRRLPGYMLPEAFAFVAEIPLNSRGKTDTAALTALGGSSAGSREPVPPKNEVERQLLGFFLAVLKRDALGVTDSFFEQGGDSLKAMQLFALIEGQYGQTLPVSLIFQSPTVASLARVIARARVDGDVIDNIVQMKQGLGQQSLFCVHEFSCDVMPYTYLVGHLEDSQPVRGLRWTQQIAERVSTIEEVAELYLRTMRAEQPSGPYHLLGYSIGGTIAYEMARQLRLDGERVGFLGLVDAVNFVKDRKIVAELSVVTFKNVLLWLRGMSLDYKIAYLTATVGRVPSLRRLRQLFGAQRQLKAMALRYRPGPIDCDVVLFKSRSSRIGVGADLGWKQVAGGLEICEIESDHISILNEVHAAEIARRIGPAFAPTRSR
jgi:amino acid adenylation domain-containing protein